MCLDYSSKNRGLVIVGVALLTLISATAIADVPQIINYQGMLSDESGEPVEDNEYPIRFRIHDDSTAYSPVWTSQPETVLVVNGLFNYQLGSNEPIPPWTFNDSALWLGITVGTGPEVPEITPRTRLVSVPYAVKAWRAESAEYADSVNEATLSILTESYNGTTDPGDGTMTVSYPPGSFSYAPDIMLCLAVLRESAMGMPKGALAHANVSGITQISFDVEVVLHKGSTTTMDGVDVTIYYVAK